MRFVILFPTLLLSCNLVLGIDPATIRGPDASADADATPAPDGGRSCACAAPFRQATVIASLATAFDEGPIRMSSDELTAYFATTRGSDGGGFDATQVWVATRPNRSAPFEQIKPLAEIASSKQTSFPTVTADGLTLYFESTRVYDTDYTWRATRKTTGDPFGEVSLASMGGSQPYVVPSGRAVYVMKGDDIGWMPIDGGNLGVLVPVNEINTPATEWSPVVTPDELLILWASTRSGQGARGAFDMWCADRSNAGEPFGRTRNVTELNSAFEEEPTWVSADGCRLYFKSNRPGKGGVDVYVAERDP